MADKKVLFVAFAIEDARCRDWPFARLAGSLLLENCQGSLNDWNGAQSGNVGCTSVGDAELRSEAGSHAAEHRPRIGSLGGFDSGDEVPTFASLALL